MKKLFFFFFAISLLAGCSKDEETGITYTEQQQKALSVFNGTWADIQFSNLGNYPGSELQPNPDKIIFGTALGTLGFLGGAQLDKSIRKKKGKQLVDYQKVIFPVGTLLILSLVFYFLLP